MNVGKKKNNHQMTDDMMEEIYVALCKRRCGEKTTFLGKDN